MADKDLYAILGVSKSADKAAIKKAYRKLARKYHPDLNPGDTAAEKRFKEINEAYEILSDDARRKQYDQFGMAAFDQTAGPGGPGGFQGFSFDSSAFGGGFEDIFSSFFGGGFGGAGARTATRAQRGQDLVMSLEVSLEEAARGSTRSITYRRDAPCVACSGTGAEGGRRSPCPTCRGSGRLQSRQGIFQQVLPCSTCGGTGSTADKHCSVCAGAGSQASTETIKVRIPAGVDNGSRVRLTGRGGAGRAGGPSGDLLLELHVKPHRLFRREGSDISIDVPVTFSEAALGARIEVPTLDGMAQVTLPAGTDSGRKLRLRGKGIARPGGGAGNQYVVVRVVMPARLSEHQKDALAEVEKAYEENPRTRLFRTGDAR